MRRAALLAVLFHLLVALLPTSPAAADSWMAPRLTTYYSANRTHRLTVTPHVPTDRNLRPYVTEPRGPSASNSARAVLQHRDVQGRWRTQWEGPLRNEVMPVNALVADSGLYFATFDDWGGTGSGPNVVVIYRADGNRVRSYRLEEVVPAYMVDAFARSVSSLHWQGEGTRFEGGHLRLSIVEPGGELFATARALFVDIDLATGSVMPIPDSDLVRWRPRACEIHRRAVAALRAYIDGERADLTAPTSETAEAWESYGYQVANRLYSPNVPLVIRLPEAADRFYAMNLSSFRHFLVTPAENQDPEGDRRVFVAVRQNDLVAEVERAAALLPRGRLAGVEMTFVADGSHWPRIVAALARSGAALRQVDPSVPLPQQARRLAELPSERVVDPACAG